MSGQKGPAQKQKNSTSSSTCTQLARQTIMSYQAWCTVIYRNSKTWMQNAECRMQATKHLVIGPLPLPLGPVAERRLPELFVHHAASNPAWHWLHYMASLSFPQSGTIIYYSQTQNWNQLQGFKPFDSHTSRPAHSSSKPARHYGIGRQTRWATTPQKCRWNMMKPNLAMFAIYPRYKKVPALPGPFSPPKRLKWIAISNMQKPAFWGSLGGGCSKYACFTTPVSRNLGDWIKMAHAIDTFESFQVFASVSNSHRMAAQVSTGVSAFWLAWQPRRSSQKPVDMVLAYKGPKVKETNQNLRPMLRQAAKQFGQTSGLQTLKFCYGQTNRFQRRHFLLSHEGRKKADNIFCDIGATLQNERTKIINGTEGFQNLVPLTSLVGKQPPNRFQTYHTHCKQAGRCTLAFASSWLEPVRSKLVNVRYFDVRDKKIPECAKNCAQRWCRRIGINTSEHLQTNSLFFMKQHAKLIMN